MREIRLAFWFTCRMWLDCIGRNDRQLKEKNENDEGENERAAVGRVNGGCIPWRCWYSCLVVVMATFRPMDMGWRFLRRRSQLPGEHNATGFVLLGQMFCNLGMKGFDIADHAEEKSA